MIVTTYKGMGDALVSLPSYANCDPRDTACVNANEGLNTQYNLNVQEAQANNNYTQCLANAANAVGTAQIQATLAACNGQFITQAPVGAAVPSSVAQVTTTPQVGSAGQFSFSTSNGLPMNVGDSWTVNITGAPIGVGVSVSGSKNGVSFGTVSKGVTSGAQGNFTLSGTVTAADAGSWNETWMVGNSPVGNISFVVNSVPGLVATIVPTVTTTTTPPSLAPAGSIVSSSSNGTVAPQASTTVFDLFGDTSNPISIGSFQIGEYTALGLAAALVVGFMMMGKRGRF